MSEKNKITKFLIKTVSIFIKTAIIAISITYGSIVAVLSIPEFLKNIKKSTFGENLNPELVRAASHRLKNFEGKHFFIKASDGIKLHVFIRKHGGNIKSKGTILFLHGFPSFWYSWKDQIEFFYTKGYDVVAPDLRGYSQSDRPWNPLRYCMDQLCDDVNSVIDSLDHFFGESDKNVILVGHDWGGLIASAFSGVYPKKVKKLVLINTTHIGASFHGFLTGGHGQIFKSFYIFFFQLPIIAELLPVPIKNLDKKGAPDTLDEIDRVALKMQFSGFFGMTGGINLYRGNFMWGLYFRDAEFMKKYTFCKIKTDTVMIWGRNDVYFDPEIPEVNGRYFLNYKVDYLEDRASAGEGHWCLTDRSREVNKKMLSFIE